MGREKKNAHRSIRLRKQATKDESQLTFKRIILNEGNTQISHISLPFGLDLKTKFKCTIKKINKTRIAVGGGGI